jgi:hypothetical protein
MRGLLAEGAVLVIALVGAMAHDDHACERFASSLAWAYWPSRYNIMSVQTAAPGQQFREILPRILGRVRARRSAGDLPTGRSSPTLRRAS